MVKQKSLLLRVLLWDIKPRESTTEEMEYWKEKLERRSNLYVQWHKNNFINKIVKQIKEETPTKEDDKKKKRRSRETTSLEHGKYLLFKWKPGLL